MSRNDSGQGWTQVDPKAIGQGGNAQVSKVRKADEPTGEIRAMKVLINLKAYPRFKRG